MALKFDYRKNLLDLHYQRYLQYKIVTLIVMFAYFTAVILGFFTKQLKMTDKVDLIFVGIFSVIMIVLGYLFLNEFNYHLKRIPKEMKKLR